MQATEAGRLAPEPMNLSKVRHHRNLKGVTLLELLCVCLIIGILASLLLPAVFRAYRRAKAMQEEFDAPVVFEQLLNRTRGYCSANPKYRFENKDDFMTKCDLPSKCCDWMNFSRTEFTPFTFLNDTNEVILVFHYGSKYRSMQSFTKGKLTIKPDE